MSGGGYSEVDESSRARGVTLTLAEKNQGCGHSYNLIGNFLDAYSPLYRRRSRGRLMRGHYSNPLELADKVVLSRCQAPRFQLLAELRAIPRFANYF